MHVGGNHDLGEFMESHFWFPTKNLLRFGGVTDQDVYFDRTLITQVVFDKFLPIKVNMREGRFSKLAHTVCFAGGQHEIVPVSMLKYPPYPFDILRRISPVSFRIEIAEKQFLLQPVFDRGDGARNFAGNERFAAPGTFMVEQNAVARAKTITFTVVYRRPK